MFFQFTFDFKIYFWYGLKIIFIPTLIVITLLGFVISINAPGDPVERMVTSSQSGGEMGAQSLSQQKDKLFWRQKLGLDLPVFYFSLTTFSKKLQQ